MISNSMPWYEVESIVSNIRLLCLMCSLDSRTQWCLQTRHSSSAFSSMRLFIRDCKCYFHHFGSHLQEVKSDLFRTEKCITICRVSRLMIKTAYKVPRLVVQQQFLPLLPQNRPDIPRAGYLVHFQTVAFTLSVLGHTMAEFFNHDQDVTLSIPKRLFFKSLRVSTDID